MALSPVFSGTQNIHREASVSSNGQDAEEDTGDWIYEGEGGVPVRAAPWSDGPGPLHSVQLLCLKVKGTGGNGRCSLIWCSSLRPFMGWEHGQPPARVSFPWAGPTQLILRGQQVGEGQGATEESHPPELLGLWQRRASTRGHRAENRHVLKGDKEEMDVAVKDKIVGR